MSAPAPSMESADKETITMSIMRIINVIIIIITIIVVSTMGKILIMFTMFHLPLGVGDPLPSPRMFGSGRNPVNFVKISSNYCTL